MANYDRHKPAFSKPFEVGIHFTLEELAKLEEKARNLSRMDWTDKVKLIKQAEHALSLRDALK